MTGKAKPNKHTTKEFAAKLNAATTNRGGGKAGLIDRSGLEKGGHAKLECPLCKVTAPDNKTMKIHHAVRHRRSAVGPRQSPSRIHRTGTPARNSPPGPQPSAIINPAPETRRRGAQPSVHHRRSRHLKLAAAGPHRLAITDPGHQKRLAVLRRRSRPSKTRRHGTNRPPSQHLRETRHQKLAVLHRRARPPKTHCHGTVSRPPDPGHPSHRADRRAVSQKLAAAGPQPSAIADPLVVSRPPSQFRANRRPQGLSHHLALSRCNSEPAVAH